MEKQEVKEILCQQLKLLAEQTKERSKWQNGAEDVMRMSIGMSYIAKAIVECE